ncbi:MAG: MFS transporter [Abditibacteriales bacterium]|nr:MFS transporter [Abditibacteriales bacterium]MDW8366637.1 MFS transporter [Abditibacteriales bacterium]
MAASDGQRGQGLSRLQVLHGMRFWNLSSAFSAVFNSITSGTVSTGYALHLGASNAQIGLLSAAPLWGQVLQLVSPLLVERLRQRKPLCLVAYLVGWGVWLPIALIPFLIPESLRPLRPWVMILLTVCGGAMVALSGPASTSWLADLVPQEMRGRFVARQQSIVAACSLVASILAGKYVDLFPEARWQIAFCTVFLLALVFAVASLVVWALVPEPPMKGSRQESVVGFLLLPLRHENFRNFVMFVSVRAVAVMIAAPFFTVFMLKTLKLSYAEVAVYTALMSLSQLAANPLWGYLADKYGYKPILRISSFAIALVPLPWVFATPHNYKAIVPLMQCYAGAMSAGLMVSQFNLMVKIAPEASRTVYVGFYSAVVNVSFALGAMLGGVLADGFARWAQLYGQGGVFLLGSQPITSVQCVFLVSALLRLLGLSFLKRVQEEESVPARVVLDSVRRGNALAALYNLVVMMRSHRAEAKVRAAKALGATKSSLVVDELIEALDDSDREVRREAARALGEIGDERAVEALVEKLHDPHADIVEESAQALGKIQDPSTFEELARLIHDEQPSVRKSAVLALGELRDVRAIALLEKRLETETEPAVFIAIAEALSKIGGTRALHRLRALLRNSQPGVGRKQLANFIGNLLGPEGAFYALLEMDALTQEATVARILQTSRRRLGGRRAGSEENRAYIEKHLTAALQQYTEEKYSGAIIALRRVASRVVRSFVMSERGAASLREDGSNLRVEKKVGLLLEEHERLRTNFGFLCGMEREAHRRDLHGEEALLSVFAFQQVVNELVRLARERRVAVNGFR